LSRETADSSREGKKRSLLRGQKRVQLERKIYGFPVSENTGKEEKRKLEPNVKRGKIQRIVRGSDLYSQGMKSSGKKRSIA